MKVKSRSLSFVVVLFVYLLAGAVGIYLYTLMQFDFWLNLLFADIASTIIVFIFSLVFKNASMYDPYWSVQPIVILFAFAIKSSLSLSTFLPLIAVVFWGVRLTANWAYTFHGLEYQDWRYTMLHTTTGKFYPIVNFFGIHLIPTLVVYGCVLPVVFTIKHSPSANLGTIVFFLVSVIAATMQAICDIQLHKFKKHKGSGFIRVGLWKYSRHPNYLGELLMWWGIGLAALCVMPDKWYLLIGAVANTILFFAASVPMADKHQARKPGFEKYKEQTRMLLPIKK